VNFPFSISIGRDLRKHKCNYVIAGYDIGIKVDFDAGREFDS